MGSSPSRLTCCPPSSAGVTMKLMDEVAGIVAARHCKTNIVTASVDAINFHDKIRKGNRTPLTERGRLGYLGLCSLLLVHPCSPRPWSLPICQRNRSQRPLSRCDVVPSLSGV